jgi:dTMP kinase
MMIHRSATMPPRVAAATLVNGRRGGDTTATMTLDASILAGKFIVLDGPDGAGKSTQLASLADFLRQTGVELVRTRDPGGTVIGDRIRQILLDRSHEKMSIACELMLYMASRAQLVAEVIAPALRAGCCVLCDRYISSTVAYQGAGGADVEAILSAARVAVGDVWPDLTVILDIDPAAGLARLTGAKDRMEAKNLPFHRRVRELFLKQAADHPQRFAVLDASAGTEEVQRRLRETIAGHPWGE